MINKKDAKYIQSLRLKKCRDEEGAFVAEGTKLVEEILVSGLPLIKLFSTNHYRPSIAPSCPWEIVDNKALEAISRHPSPNQAVAIVRKKPLHTLEGVKTGWILIFDGVQDPGNFGTLLRSADWFGFKTVISSPDSADLYNPKTIQATMGSFLRLDVFTHPIEDFLIHNKAHQQLPVYGATLHGKDIFTLPKPLPHGILIVGNEGQGIRKNILHYITHPITIPKIGGGDSLNVAIAGSILMAHITSINQYAL